MVKSYIRYEGTKSFGLIASNANILIDITGKYFFSALLEDVGMWHLKTNELIKTFSININEDVYMAQIHPNPVVKLLSLTNDIHHISSGYDDGTIRIWNIENGKMTSYFNGHKKCITALNHSKHNSYLISGSQDTHICIWDTVSEMGITKLKGHHHEITGFGFLGTDEYLISSSKDGQLKIWDLKLYDCIQTIITPDGNEITCICKPDVCDQILIGCSNSTVYAYVFEDKTKEEKANIKDFEILSYNGQLIRKNNDKVLSIEAYNEYIVVTSEKDIEVYNWISNKNLKKKISKKKHKITNEEKSVVLSIDINYYLISRTIYRVTSKLRSICILKNNNILEILISFKSNKFEIIEFLRDESSNVLYGKMKKEIYKQGHRSVIRSLALSSDDKLLASVSEKTLIIYKTDTNEYIHHINYLRYGICCIFDASDNYVIVGCRDGYLLIFDLSSSSLIDEIKVSNDNDCCIWSLNYLPNKSGFISGNGNDSDSGKNVKFWKWDVVNIKSEEETLNSFLSFSNKRILNIRKNEEFKDMEMSDDVLSCCITPDEKYIAVATLDNVIKILFLDSYKLFLTLYGHKLPILCTDISSDSQLIVSGSADKNIKIWGLDFGDCHKSIFAHKDSVTQVKFVRGTHYIFSVGKDGMMRYWNGDKFELLLEFPGHHGEIWSLVISHNGEFLYTGSTDKSIRRWEQVDDVFFVEEEKEKRLESLFMDEINKDEENQHNYSKTSLASTNITTTTTNTIGKKTIESINAADTIVNALMIASTEEIRKIEEEKIGKYTPNPFLRGMNPTTYIMDTLYKIKPSDLEMAIMCLSFTDALSLLKAILNWLENDGDKIENVCRLALMIVKIHQQQLSSSSYKCKEILNGLQKHLRKKLKNIKKDIGFCVAGINCIKNQTMKNKDITNF